MYKLFMFTSILLISHSVSAIDGVRFDYLQEWTEKSDAIVIVDVLNVKPIYAIYDKHKIQCGSKVKVSNKNAIFGRLEESQFIVTGKVEENEKYLLFINKKMNDVLYKGFHSESPVNKVCKKIIRLESGLVLGLSHHKIIKKTTFIEFPVSFLSPINTKVLAGTNISIEKAPEAYINKNNNITYRASIGDVINYIKSVRLN